MPRPGSGRTDGRGLPAAVRERLRLDRRERPLAAAVGPAGQWYVGTERALHLVEPAGYERLRWEQVENASWHAETQTLLVVEVGEAAAGHELPIADGGRLLELLRERVTKSVVLRQYEPVRGKTGISVVARRSPIGEGPLTWSTVYAAGLVATDPVVRTAVRRARERAERELGTGYDGDEA